MRLAIDTNRYTDLRRGDAHAMAVISRADQIFLPFPVLGEIHLGARMGSRRAENEAILRRFMVDTDARTLWADDGTVSVYADLRVFLDRQGTPLPENDIWIASLCVRHSVALFTRDAHFDLLPQVMRV